MDVLKLLQNKNRSLVRFLEKSKKFLAEETFDTLDGLHSFQAYRDKTLKVVEMYDKKISETIYALLPTEKTSALIQEVKHTQEIKDNLTRAILETDQKIICKIESEQRRLLQEISHSEKSLQQVKKFKSSWISEPGENLDNKL